MSTVARYFDKYAKRTKQSPKKIVDAKADSQAYISFLEVQLDKVTQSINQTAKFDERIEEVQSQLNGVEDKIVNVKRIVKLQQSYSESQEEDFNTIRDKVENLQTIDQRSQMYSMEESLRARIDSLERRITQNSPNKTRNLENFTTEVENEMRRVETRMIDMMSNL